MAAVDGIANWSRQWGMVDMHDQFSRQAHSSAAFWHNRLANASDSCTVSWIFPYPYEDREGILCMSGQEGSSTTQHAYNSQASDCTPGWLSYGCTFYEKPYLDAVISKPSDGIHLGRAEWFFYGKFNARGMGTIWKSIVNMGSQQSIQSLLSLFCHLDIVKWRVFIARLSWRVYAGLDLWEYSYHKHGVPYFTEWVVSRRDVCWKRDVWWKRMATIQTKDWSWCNEWTIYCSKRYEKQNIAGDAEYDAFTTSISRVVKASPSDVAMTPLPIQTIWQYGGTSTMRSGNEDEEYEEFSGVFCQASCDNNKDEEYEQFSCVFCQADGGEHCGHRLV